MALSLSFFECPSCAQRTGHVRQKPSHAFHLLASFATMGLWAIVWLFVVYDLAQKGYACLNCGVEAEKRVPKTHSLWEDPLLRAPEPSGE
ncbi:MAG: hypothetical protein AAF368_12255 [Planctomycetota bacterium]